MKSQEPSAGYEKREIRTAGEKLGQLGSGIDDLLEVVEKQEHLPLADVLCDAVLGAQRLGNRLGDKRGVPESRKPNPEDARLVGRVRASEAASMAKSRWCRRDRSA